MRLLAALLLVPVVAFGVTVEPLPPPEFADTEVTAHHRLEQPTQGLRALDFRLDFNGTPSNNVEVALGHDADGDGALSLDETALSLAWDCGEWMVRGEGSSFAKATEDESGNGISLVTSEPDTNGFVSAAVDVAVSRHKAKPAWLYDRSWDLLRVTARGVDAPLERVTLSTRVSGMMVLIK